MDESSARWIKIQTFLDDWILSKLKENKKLEKGQRIARPAKLIRLLPVGYPLNNKSNVVTVSDEKLFEVYAKEQWLGTIVTKGDYLFDQRLIPDFAFKVIKTLPQGEVMITEETKIVLEKINPIYRVRTNVKFEDIVGHERVKEKCKIIMKYLKEPEKFGEWAPKNILFYGPPGTGKTMTAKALANETNSALYLIRATDLIGEYVGDASRKIHDLYKMARDTAPSIIFIDEFDAIGLDRSYQSLRGDVSEIVNALLTELDGIEENKGVVTIASTNNPMMLDRAIRSRFEEEIEFKLPNLKERYEILRYYSEKMPLKVKADLMKYAKITKGLSGRDLKEKLLKVALHKAIAEDSNEITDKHLQEALKEIKTMQNAPKEMFS